MRQAMLKLEVFETAAIDDDTTHFDAHQAEKLRESAFEQGYAAGWQDALEHMRNEDALRRIAAEEALQAISFSYHEAHAALQDAFVALTETLIAKVMPELARHALPARVAAELKAIAAQNTTLPLRLACAPTAVATLTPIIATAPGITIDLVPEPSFTDAQVALSIGAQERRIDFDALLAQLRDILADSTQHTPETETAHG